jgi:hypothetical protein
MVCVIGELAEIHRRRWAGDMVDAPERLARRVAELMLDLRLAEWTPETGEHSAFNLLPAAARFLPAPMPDASQLPVQEALW